MFGFNTTSFSPHLPSFIRILRIFTPSKIKNNATDKMKKQIVFIIILLCTAFAQAQEVFVTADFVSSYIWRGMDSGNASVQPSIGLQWKGLTVYDGVLPNFVIETMR